MESILQLQTPPIGALVDGRLDTIQRMDAERGRVAAARELQLAFFTQLIEALRRTVPEDSEDSLLPRSPTRDVYDGLFDRELASMLAANDPLGLVARLGDGGGREPGGRGVHSAAATAAPGLSGGGDLGETVLTSDAMKRAVASDEIKEMGSDGR